MRSYFSFYNINRDFITSVKSIRVRYVADFGAKKELEEKQNRELRGWKKEC